MCACTIVFEGTRSQVRAEEKHIYSLIKKHNGLQAGAQNGINGYFLTYMIAYLRDFGCHFNFMAESFETAVQWNNVALLCRNTKERIYECCKRNKISSQKIFVSCRISQVYSQGATVYIYFGFNY